MEQPTAPSRRAVVSGAAAAALGVVGVGALAACSNSASTTAAAVTGAGTVSPAGDPASAGSAATTDAGATPSLAQASTGATTAATKPAAGSTKPAPATVKPKPTPKPGTTPTPAATPKSTPKPTPKPTPAKPPGAVILLSAIPVGGSVVLGSLVVARPSAGSVTGHSSKCTHMGCTVGAAGGQLDCPCHGSKFNAFTGAVLNGPAASPLPSRAVSVVNGWVVA